MIYSFFKINDVQGVLLSMNDLLNIESREETGRSSFGKPSPSTVGEVDSHAKCSWRHIILADQQRNLLFLFKENNATCEKTNVMGIEESANNSRGEECAFKYDDHSR